MLKEDIIGYVHNCESFVSSSSFEESQPASSRAAVETMRKDVKGIKTQLDSKPDLLTAQIGNFTLTLKRRPWSPKSAPLCALIVGWTDTTPTMRLDPDEERSLWPFPEYGAHYRNVHPEKE